MHRGVTRRTALALPLAAAAFPAKAESAWPSEPIRLLVGYAPGGGADITARVVAAKLADVLAQRVLVENKPGASGIIAEEIVAKAAPDGYTLGAIAASHGYNPSLFRKLPFDSEKDFTPIVPVLRAPTVVCVHPSFPAQTLGDLIALAKAKPGTINYASSGAGTGQTMSAELLKQMAGIDLVAIQYSGGAPALVDVSAGRVPIMFGYILSTLPYIQDKRLRALAVTGSERSAMLPNVPTVAESGVPGYAVYDWNGLAGPANLPPPIVARLHDAVARILQMDDVKKRIAALGAEELVMTPAAFTRFIDSEIARWAVVIKKAGIHLNG